MRVRWHLVHVGSQKRIGKLLAPINDQLKGWLHFPLEKSFSIEKLSQ